MASARTQFGVYALAFGTAWLLLSWTGVIGYAGVSLGDVLGMVPLEIAGPLLVMVLVMLVWNPDLG